MAPCLFYVDNDTEREGGTQTCIHQNIVQRSKFEKTDLPTSELGTTCQTGIMYIMPFLQMK